MRRSAILGSFLRVARLAVVIDRDVHLYRHHTADLGIPTPEIRINDNFLSSDNVMSDGQLDNFGSDSCLVSNLWKPASIFRTWPAISIYILISAHIPNPCFNFSYDNVKRNMAGSARRRSSFKLATRNNKLRASKSSPHCARGRQGVDCTNCWTFLA